MLVQIFQWRSFQKSHFLWNEVLIYLIREMFSCHVMLWAEPTTFWSNQKGLSQFFFRHLMVWIKKGGTPSWNLEPPQLIIHVWGAAKKDDKALFGRCVWDLGKQFCFCFVHNCTLASSDVIIVSKILFTFLYYSTKLGGSIWNFVAYLYSSLNFFKIFVIWRVYILHMPYPLNDNKNTKKRE